MITSYVFICGLVLLAGATNPRLELCFPCMDAVTYVYTDLDIENNDVSITDVKNSLDQFCKESVKTGKKCIEWNSEEIYWMHKRLHTKYNPGQTCSNYLGYCDAPHCTFCG